MNRLQTPLVRLAGLALCLAALPCLPASAHDVSPSSAELRPGTSSLIYVEDFTNCKADITVQTSSPLAVQVWALDPLTGNKVPGDGIIAFVPDSKVAYFLIEGAPGVTSTVTVPVTVCWIGEGWPSGTCNENNCFPVGIPHVVPVTVKPSPFTGGAWGNAGVVGDPISTGSGGVYTERREVLSLGGPLPVELGMQYDSTMEAAGIPPGNMGPGWRNDTDWVLRIVGDGAYEVTTPDGRVARFRRGPPDWDYVAETYLDVPFQLSRPNPGTEYKLFDPRSGLVYSFANLGIIGWSSRAIRVEDGKGNVQTRLATSNGPVTKILDGLGRQLTLTYVGGRLTTVSDGTRTATFTYDGQGQLVSYTDVAGHTTTFSYDPAFPGQGQLVAEQLPEGNVPFTQVFDVEKRVTQQSDAASNVTTIAYGPGELTTVMDPLGYATEHLHDEGKLTTHTDPMNNAIVLGYNPDEQRTSILDRLGFFTSLAMHSPSGGLEQLTDATGAVTTIGYGVRTQLGFEAWDLVSELLANGATWSYVHDAAGNLVSATDGDGYTTTFTYNAKGQVLTASDPSGAVWTRTYNPDGTLATAVDPQGHTTSFNYDSLRRLVGVQHPDGTSVSWTLDAEGLVTSATNEENETTQYAYDTNDRLTSIIFPSGASRSFVYDTQNLLDQQIDGLGQATQYDYDERHHLWRIQKPSGQVWEQTIDGTGFLGAFKDPSGAVTQFDPDAEGNNQSTTNPLGLEQQYTYDATGRPLSCTNPGGGTWAVTRDVLGQVNANIDPLGAVTSYTRDGRGNVTGITGALTGVNVTLVYDSRGDLIEIKDSQGNSSKYTYDSRRDRIESEDSLLRRILDSYDVRGLLEKTTLPGSLGHVDYTWTADALPSQASGSDGATRTYTYDSDNRLIGGKHLSRTHDAAGRISNSNGLPITRDVDGQATMVEFVPGDYVTYTYGPSGEIVGMLDSWGNSVTLSYNAAKQITQIQRSSGPTSKYEYGPDGRCKKEQHGSIYEAELVYDGRGKLVGKKVFSAPQVSSPLASSLACSYDPANQRIGETWDDLGRLLADAQRQCTWNTLGDLTECTSGADTVKCEYDTFGRLYSLEEVGSGIVQSFVWNDACGGGPAIVRENGVDAAYFATTPEGVPMWQIDPATGDPTWLLGDVEGNMVATTDDTGSPQCAHEYLPFGEPLPTWGTCDCIFTFGAASGDVYVESCGILLTAQGARETTFGRRLSPRELGVGVQACNGYLDLGSSDFRTLVLGSSPSTFVERLAAREGAGLDPIARAQYGSRQDSGYATWSGRAFRIPPLASSNYSRMTAVGKYSPRGALQRIRARELSRPSPRDPFWNYGTVLPERPEGWRSGEAWYDRRDRLKRESTSREGQFSYTNVPVGWPLDLELRDAFGAGPFSWLQDQVR